MPKRIEGYKFRKTHPALCLAGQGSVAGNHRNAEHLPFHTADKRQQSRYCRDNPRRLPRLAVRPASSKSSASMSIAFRRKAGMWRTVHSSASPRLRRLRNSIKSAIQTDRSRR